MDRRLAGPGVRGAAEARVIGAESHLDDVQEPVGDVTLLDEVHGRLFHREVDGGVVVGRPDDQVGLLDDTPLVGLVMMIQGAPGRLDDADALVGSVAGDDTVIGPGDVGVGGQFHPALGRVEELDQPGPVGRQSLMDGLPAQGFVHPVVFLVGQGCGHAVGDVEARERCRFVDAALGAVDEALPADFAEDGELEVGPWLDVFDEMLEVVGRLELGQLPPSGLVTRMSPS